MGEIVERWLASQIPSTRKVYATVARDLARCSTIEALLADRYQAREIVGAYRAAMYARGLGVGTIATRIGVVQGLVAYARQVGVIDWTLELAAPPSCWGPGMGFVGQVGEEACG